MPHTETESLPPPSGAILSHCPECSAGLVVMSIIPGRVGRGGCEYWTMRCTHCGGIHLDIVEPRSSSQTA
jgi:uncharacterized Zn finger protein